MESKHYLVISLVCLSLIGVILFFETFYGVYDELSCGDRSMDLAKNRSYSHWLSVGADENLECTYELKNNKFTEAEMRVEVRVEKGEDFHHILKKFSVSIESMEKESVYFMLSPKKIGLDPDEGYSLSIYWDGEEKREIRLSIYNHEGSELETLGGI